MKATNKLINCILLIDDNEDDNYIHQMILERSGKFSQVKAVLDGVEALEYLQSKDKVVHPRPNIIILDINMPKMNGYEFLEAYKALDEDHKADIFIAMLSTNLYPEDSITPDVAGEVTIFYSKPLSAPIVDEIITCYNDQAGKS